MAIRTEYKELALYTDGNMVKIATGTYFVASFPRGEIVARPYNTNVGFVFQSLRTNELIAIVTDYTQVKDATGTPYPGTFDQVLTTINGILDTTGGGGGGGGDATAANQVIMIDELVDINTELDNQTGLLQDISDLLTDEDDIEESDKELLSRLIAINKSILTQQTITNNLLKLILS